MCILAVINMSKSGRIITTAFQDDDAAELMIAGMKTFMIILITLSVIFTAILVSKYIILREKNHIYIAGAICGVLFLITAINGATLSGFVTGNIVPEDKSEAVGAVIALFDYIGLSKLTGCMFIGIAAWTVYILLKGRVKVVSIPQKEEEVQSYDEIDG